MIGIKQLPSVDPNECVSQSLLRARWKVRVTIWSKSFDRCRGLFDLDLDVSFGTDSSSRVFTC
jgi:hypothetical protein